MSKKKHPLKIQPYVEENGDILGYFSKGHHDDEAFLAALVAETDEPRAAKARVWRVWHRFIPGGSDGPEGGMYYQAEAGERGACPVTEASCVFGWPE